MDIQFNNTIFQSVTAFSTVLDTDIKRAEMLLFLLVFS
jgi:hypothetical protein